MQQAPSRPRADSVATFEAEYLRALNDLSCPPKEASMADQPQDDETLRGILCTSADRCTQAASIGPLKLPGRAGT
ncbi:hypothetical protein WJX84_006995 [Apatococcus fuscideae]|uniref:Uncharacterized protein n=1 Tax=Apatococcus fuscideae TaxID=2026836 RepID=A0AAW1TBT8_9CHLO